MLTNKYPVGQINAFDGDITILDDNQKLYWIANAFVSTKKDLKPPYLQIPKTIKVSVITIAANGDFNMKIHISEYYNSINDYI